jgi:hypothetical protein
MCEVTINIAIEFSTTPGARYRKDGKYSGEEFREVYLEPHFDGEKDYKIKVIMDGAEGYATSFLEECFGGLRRLYGEDVCLKRLVIISEEDPLLIEEIERYIKGELEDYISR